MAGSTKPLLTICAACALLAAAPLAAEQAAGGAVLPISLNADVRFLSKSAAPFIRDQWVVFSYRPGSSARYVALRFEHEEYAVLHPYQLNEQRTFVLVYRPPAGIERLTYRISVDGLWMRDPANPDASTDAFGTAYSHVDLSALRPAPPQDPAVLADGRVTFTYRGDPGEIVSVAGTFNRWDPYLHVLDEIGGGTYSLTLRLPPGPYYYYFLENGRKRLDPDNAELRHASDGELVCYFQIP